jgi:4-amino-4-deoxy-L-arabinose transferase-like glycosyltransferase
VLRSGPSKLTFRRTRYATNLVDHGVYSMQEAPPYAPSMYRPPGYPVFLAILRVAGGDSLLLVRVVQFMLLGVLAFLVYAITHRLSDRRTARLSALLCLTYLPFVWLARMHMSEVLATVSVTLTVFTLMRAQTLRQYLLVGALLGGTGLVRPVFALAAGPILIGIFLSSRLTSTRTAATQAAAVALGMAVALAPWTIRNYALSESFVPFGGGGGIAALASAMQYDGTVGYSLDKTDHDRLAAIADPAIVRAHAEAAEDRSSVQLNLRKELAVEVALRTEAKKIAADVGIAEALRRLPRREAYLWAVSDYPPGSPGLWHRVAQVQHVLLFALALLGAIVGTRRGGLALLWPVLLFPAYLACAHVVFLAAGRYSVPARAVVIVLAAIGFAFLVERAGPMHRWRGAT